MECSEIVKSIMDGVQVDDIVIASTGFISREVYRQKDRPLNFYMQGSMGCALGIGIGVSMNVSQRVFVISGDGSALMGLGTMVTAAKMNLPNLIYMIVDNGAHESTGGQPTASDSINFSLLYRNTIVYKADEYKDIPPRIKLSPTEITKRFVD